LTVSIERDKITLSLKQLKCVVVSFGTHTTNSKYGNSVVAWKFGKEGYYTGKRITLRVQVSCSRLTAIPLK